MEKGTKFEIVGFGTVKFNKMVGKAGRPQVEVTIITTTHKKYKPGQTAKFPISVLPKK